MEDDIRLITFCRKTIHDTKTGTADLEGESGNYNSSGGTDGIITTATDYFDALIIENLEDTRMWEGLINKDYEFADANNSSDFVAVHRYPIYCSGDVIARFGKEDHCGDPTEKRDFFLSLIQVHITPEVMARVIADNPMDLFQRDLHNIISKLNFKEDKFVYRVYRAMAVGDFAVLIRSHNPETPFRISSSLRKRVIGNKIKLVLYKTYTVLSISNVLIGSAESRKGTDNCFSLRCCYSNKYWANKADIDKASKKYAEEIQKNVVRIYGRYDISVTLREEELYKLNDVIASYKGYNVAGEVSTGYAEGDLQFENDVFNLAGYVEWLLKKGCLSYINIRYLMKLDKESTAENDKESTEESNKDLIKIEQMEKKKFIYENNEEECDGLLGKYKSCKSRIDSYLKAKRLYKEKLKYYFELLEKLILRCKTINGLSDTRIYANILMKQLSVILDCIEYYFKNDYGTKNIETELRDALQALNSYANYIRNNNMQSLQTPNYTIEANFSIEKYLIGYSGFLMSLLSNYEKITTERELGAPTYKLHPVFEPDFLGNPMNVIVLFQNKNCGKNDFDSAKNRLMLVRCSTVKEILNVPATVTALTHEVSHQFRFETREERNMVIIKYAIGSAFMYIAEEILREAAYDIPQIEKDDGLSWFIAAELADVYCKKIFFDENNKNKLSDYYGTIPLSILKDKIISSFWNFCKRIEIEGEINRIVKAIVERVKFNVDIHEEKNVEGIKHLGNFSTLTEEINGGNAENFGRKLQGAIDAVRDLKQSADNLEEMEWLISEMESLRNAEDRLAELNIDVEDIFSEVYARLCGKVKEKQLLKSSMSYRMLGRYLGIDNEHTDSKKEFADVLKRTVPRVADRVRAGMETAIEEYREIMADLFMVEIMQLTPFGYINFMSSNVDGGRASSDNLLERMWFVLSTFYNEDTNQMFGEIIKNIVKWMEQLAGNTGWDGGIDESASHSKKLEQLYKVCELAPEYMSCERVIVWCIQLITESGTLDRRKKRFVELREDLETGRKIIPGIVAKLRDGKEKTYLSSFAGLWNDPTEIKKEDLNHNICEFILDMYYENKFESARGCIRKENV